MKHLFLALAVVGTVLPYAAFMPWLLEHGLDVPLLLSDMFATEVSTFFTVDVIVSALAVFAMVGRGLKQRVRYAWLAALGTLSVGVSLGLPLYLYLEARHTEASRTHSGVEDDG